MAHAKQCQCGHPSCKHWHVHPQAAVQGVCFTKEEAEAIATLLNSGEVSTNLQDVYGTIDYNLEEIEGCFEEYKNMPCNSLLEKLKGSISKAKLSINKIKEERHDERLRT